ncbi:hypothetical protein B0J14DRAFT_482472, partial [Halenospora varia]
GTNLGYLSLGVTSIAIHLEDRALCSINVVRAGVPKLWLVVPPQYKEELTHKLVEEQQCLQSVCHTSVLVPPCLLD